MLNEGADGEEKVSVSWIDVLQSNKTAGGKVRTEECLSCCNSEQK